MPGEYESWAQWLTSILALVQLIMPGEWAPSYQINGGERYNYIVIGAGSAGAIVASRLSEDPWVKVLLIEAGGDPSLASVVPPLFTLLQNSEYDWNYRAYYDKGTGQGLTGGLGVVPRGKCLGGSSSINMEIYARGVPEDYEWEDYAPGWTWNTVLPFFKKSEGMLDCQIMNDPQYSHRHSADGPVLVSRPEINWYFEEKNNYMYESFEEIGVKRIFDMNGPNILGITRPHFTYAFGRRYSTAEAFLKKDKVSVNLSVAKYTRASKVLIDVNTKHAYGVEVILESGETLQVFADREVIVSAGSIESPKLLMLSGIGPAEELQKFDINMIKNLPVGKNLHDHICVPLALKGQKGNNSKLLYYYGQKEMGATIVPVVAGYFNIDKSSSKPQFIFFNVHADANAVAVFRSCKALNVDDASCQSIQAANLNNELDVIMLGMLHPKSKGQVRLRSKNINDDPIIELGFFRNKEDELLFSEAAQFVARLENTTYFKKVNGGVAQLVVTGCEGIEFGAADYWRCYVRNAALPFLHPTGTCRIGPDGVVDGRLKVHGISGLRVADASVIPEVPSANTNAAAMMIGEFAAELIKADNK